MTKVLKYELKQTWRMGITLVLSTLLGCLGLIFNPFSTYSALGQIYIGIFTIITIASPLALFLYNMVSFNQEFTRPQGYLMMTLPVKASDFIWAKFTNQLMWNSLCFLIGVSMAPFLIGRYPELRVIQLEMNKIDSIVVFASSLIIYSLGALIIYFSVAILSMQPRSSHNSFMKVILALILLNITSFLTNALAVLIPFIIKGGFPKKGLVIRQISDYMQIHVQEVNIYNIIINVIMAVIFYLMTKNIIENKVQL